ncbi:ArnT family glycosyltransferase [Lactobacillaceae bacterium Scapto_B20]
MEPKKLGLNWPAVIGMVAFSFILMLFLSTSSPLYPINSSPDANIMMTVGKGFWHGLMPYQDLFDNRGPLIYLLFSLFSLISYQSFIAIYLLESILLFVDLILSYLILKRFMAGRLAYSLSFFILPLMFNEYFFQHGDTPESLIIPFMLATFYQLLKHQDFKFSKKTLLIQGLFVGIAFWIKYTLIIPWIGIGIVIGITYLFKKRFVDLFKLLGFGLVGYLIVTIPILWLYQAKHILPEMLKVYFWFNVKYYQHSNFDLTQLISLPQVDVVALWVEVMIVLMMITIALMPRVNWQLKVAFELSLIIETLAIITVKVTATYYYTLISVFAIFILIIIGALLQRGLPKMVIENPLLPCLLIAIAVCGICISNHNYHYSRLYPHNQVYSFNKRSTEPYQERFAKIINRSRDRSLLAYRTIDVSLYTNLGTMPTNKYFVQNNLDYPPMHESQKQQLKSLKNKYVLTISLPPSLDTVASKRSVNRVKHNKTLKKHYHLVDQVNVLKYTSSVQQYELRYYLFERNQ